MTRTRKSPLVRYHLAALYLAIFCLYGLVAAVLLDAFSAAFLFAVSLAMTGWLFRLAPIVAAELEHEASEHTSHTSHT